MIDYRLDNRWIVYVHIVPKYISNYDHDKYYVGITGRKPERRWVNGYGYKDNSYFFNAIRKYGWNNIEHEIIAEHLTKDEAINLEITLIKLLSSNNEIHGYNLTSGGDGVTGYKFSEEQLQKMRERNRGEKNYWYGKQIPEEIRKKMSENHYDCSGAKNPRAEPIYQFDIDFNFVKKYPSAADADKECNCRFIGGAALQRSLTHNSYWARKKDIFIDENGTIQLKNKHLYDTKSEVFQFDKNWNYINRYISGGEAGRINQSSPSHINRAIKNKHMACGYCWVKKEDIDFINNIPVVKDEIKKIILNNMDIKNKEKQKHMVQVVNIENNQLFNSYASAAQHYEITYSNIKSAAEYFASGKNRKCKGYHWLRYDDYLKKYNLTDEEARKRLFFIV